MKKLALNWSAIIGFLIIWQVVAMLEIVSTPTFFPTVADIAYALWDEALSGKLLANILVSLRRALVGLGCGLAVAIPLGLAIGWFDLFGRIISPLLHVFRNMPVLALLPVFVMFFGIGELSKVVVILWGVLWSTLLNTISGVQSVDPQLIKAARSMSTGPFRMFASVVLPGALPYIFTGVRLSATISVLILIAAEMMGAQKGLGFALYFYQANFLIPKMYAYIVVMAVIGTSINYGLEAAERRMFRWRSEIRN